MSKPIKSQPFKTGYIKATYVQILDKSGVNLFSLQADAFGKDTPVCYAMTTELSDHQIAVPVTISDELKSVLETYVNELLKMTRGATLAAQLLVYKHFKVKVINGKDVFYMTDTTFYVVPNTLTWKNQATTINPETTPNIATDPDIAPDPEPTPKSNKTKWALIAAAALAFLN